MKDITDEIIDYLIRNRVSTTEVTDGKNRCNARIISH